MSKSKEEKKAPAVVFRQIYVDVEGPYELSASLDRPFEVEGDLYFPPKSTKPSDEREPYADVTGLFPLDGYQQQGPRPIDSDDEKEILYDFDHPYSYDPSHAPQVPYKPVSAVNELPPVNDVVEYSCDSYGRSFAPDQLRIHCQICEDHDICADCQLSGRHKPPHSALHQFVIIQGPHSPPGGNGSTISGPIYTRPSPSSGNAVLSPNVATPRASPEKKPELEGRGIPLAFRGKSVSSEKIKISDESVKNHYDQLLEPRWFVKRDGFPIAEVKNATESATKKFGTVEVAHWAARTNIVMLFQLSSEFGLAEATDHNKWTPLHWACYSGSVNVAQYLIKNDADVNVKTLNMWTPLHLAVQGQQKTVIRYLLEEICCDGDSEDYRGWAPLQWAITSSDESTVAIVASHDYRYFKTTFDNWTELHAAVLREDRAILDFLIQKDKKSLDHGNYQDDKPIHIAARLGNEKIFRTLLDASYTYRDQTSHGETVLHIAAENDFASLVPMIMAKEPGIQVRNGKCDMPLHTATKNDSLDTAKALVKHGTKIKVSSIAGLLVLDGLEDVGESATMRFLLETAKKHYTEWALEDAKEEWQDHALIFAGPEKEPVEDIEFIDEEIAKDSHGIIVAAACGDIPLLREFVYEYRTGGRELTVLDSALFKAARIGNRDVVKMFIDAGAKMHKFHKRRNDEGEVLYWTPLHAAAVSGHNTIVGMLHSGGADVNAFHKDHKDPYSQTALQATASGGHVHIVSMLLGFGAVMKANGEHSAFAAAMHADRLDVAELLLERGAVRHEGAGRLLRIAALNQSQSMVSTLLHKYRSPVNEVGEPYCSALACAAFPPARLRRRRLCYCARPARRRHGP